MGATQYNETAAISTAHFLDTLGVNVHTTYSNTLYANTALVEQSLQYLNFIHVRDGINPVGAYNSVGQEKLAADGYKFDFVTSVPTADKMAALDWYATNHSASVFSVEGPNEIGYAPIPFDGGTSVANEIALQQALYDAVRGDPKLSGVNVVNFTLGLQNSMSYSDLGDMSSAVDQGNAHVYAPYGFSPAYDWNGILSLEGAPTAGKPMVITEAGYTTTPNYVSGVDETVQAKYTLDLLMDSAKSGVAQIYLYELLDEKPDPTGASNQQHYGLFRNDGTSKPAADAIHNLTTILADSADGAPSPMGALPYSVSGLPANGFQVLFEKQNGVYDIALWAEPNIWNSTLHQEVAAPVNTVTVTFGHIEHTVTAYDPLLGTTPIAIYSDVSQIDVSITDHPLIVEVDDGKSVPVPPPILQRPSISIDAEAGASVTVSGNTNGDTADSTTTSTVTTGNTGTTSGVTAGAAAGSGATGNISASSHSIGLGSDVHGASGASGSTETTTAPTTSGAVDPSTTTNHSVAGVDGSSSFHFGLHTFQSLSDAHTAQGVDGSGRGVATFPGGAMHGWSGNNTVRSAAGNDSFAGTGHSDTFEFAPHFGHGVIKDFATGGSGCDAMHASRSVFDSFASVLSHAAQSGHDIAMPTGSDTFAKNANFDALSKHDFHFA